MERKNIFLPFAFEDALSEDSTHCAVSPGCSSSSVAGITNGEDEAACGIGVKELDTITENDCSLPSFASFYNEFLHSEAIVCSEIANETSSATTRRKRPHTPSKPVTQLAFLADVIKGFQRLEFQIGLQRLLLDIQACQCSPSCDESAMYEIAMARTDLELSVYHEMMHKHGITQHRDPLSGKIPVWEFIASFLDDADVSRRLAEIDELLALPLNSTLDEVSAWRTCNAMMR
jgi:hypothetical protein